MRPFEPREITFRGTRARRGWTLKVYSVRVAGPPIDWPGFDAALEAALGALPSPDPEAGRPGLGLFIAHQGTTGDYGVLGWWNHENELPFQIMVRRGPDESWRTARNGESICVWDLEIVWEERQAWIDTMLAPVGADPDAYLVRVPERFLPERGDPNV